MLNEDELKDAIVLVYANKQDLPNSLGIDELTNRLKLQQLESRPWFIQATCATTGTGLYDGMDWLSYNLKHY